MKTIVKIGLMEKVEPPPKKKSLLSIFAESDEPTLVKRQTAFKEFFIPDCATQVVVPIFGAITIKHRIVKEDILIVWLGWKWVSECEVPDYRTMISMSSAFTHFGYCLEANSDLKL